MFWIIVTDFVSPTARLSPSGLHYKSLIQDITTRAILRAHQQKLSFNQLYLTCLILYAS